MIRYLDLLSSAPQLFIDGKFRFQNNIGGFLTGSLFILSLVAFIHFASRITQRLDPNVTFNQIHKINGTELVINTTEKNDYEFYLVDGTTSKVIEEQEKYWEIHAWMTTWDFVDGKEEFVGGKQINFTLCQNSTIEGAYCFAPNQTLKIANAFIQFPYSLFYISVRECHTRTDCKSKEEIREKLKFSFFKVKVPTFYVNSDNYETPLIPFVKSTEAIVTTSITRRGYYFFKEIQYSSDDGLILQNIKEEKKVILNTFTDTTSIIQLLSDFGGKDIYFETFWAFENAGIQDVYKREYKKIQNVLAEIGGFINGIKMMALVILYIYFEYAYYLHIFKYFFFFENTGGVTKTNNIIIHSRLSMIDSALRLEPKNKTRVVLPGKLSIVKTIFCRCKRNEVFNRLVQNFKLKYADIKSLILLRNEIEILKYHLIEGQASLKVYDHLKKLINSQENFARPESLKDKDFLKIINNYDPTVKKLNDYYNLM